MEISIYAESNKITGCSLFDKAKQSNFMHYLSVINYKILYKGKKGCAPISHLKDDETDSARNYLYTFSCCNMSCINGIGRKDSAISSHQLAGVPKNNHTSTHDLCGPYNTLQSADRKQFPILKEAHHQHSQQMSMAL